MAQTMTENGETPQRARVNALLTGSRIQLQFPDEIPALASILQ